MPQEMTEENAWKSTEIKKRNPSRRNPEKRRQQNIIAQRKYREKLRERLGRLDALESSAAQNSPIANTLQSDSISIQDVAGLSASLMATPMDSEPFPQADNAASSLNFWDFATYPTPSDKPLSSLGSWDPTVWECATEATPSTASPSTLAVTNNTKHLHPQEISSTQGVYRSPTHVGPSSQEVDKTSDSLDGFYVISTVECNCNHPHLQVQTRDCVAVNCIEVRILKLGSPTPPPDPYANHLRLEVICTLSAMDALRMHVGVTEGMMCEDEGPSPFYRPIRASTENTAKNDMICTVQRIFKTLKPDLRPSVEQITIDHPPYIDVLPFRTLRKNLILGQSDVDEDEFLRDAVTGLVCWGGAGLSRKERNTSTGYASSGTPWDNRSWEAKAWFEKKYWSLLGGEDGELVQQSEWWRNIRGDDAMV